MDRVDLSDCRWPGQAVERLADRRRHRPGPVIAGGARPESWSPPGWPRLVELDEATEDEPAVIWCFDTHTAMINSVALRRLGINSETPDPPDGVIERDSSGNPTGVLSESAVEAARRLEPVEGPRADRYVEIALRDLADHGFVEVHDMKSEPGLPRRIERARAAIGDACPRVVLYPLVEDLPAFAAARNEWETDAVRLGGGKIFLDGTLNSRTAWTLDPWADTGGTGVAMHAEPKIREAVALCESLGFPIAMHAIGDAAVRAGLDAIESVAAVASLGGAVGRHRIEHVQLCHPDDVPRFAKLGVIASMQPCHLLYDIETLRRGCPDRLDRAQPARSLIDAGCEPGELLWFGSDAPVVRPDPGDSLQAAIERRRVGMDADGAIAPEQAVSAEQAASCFLAR